jgi:selenocysteine lyase/cysteine desulfurase
MKNVVDYRLSAPERDARLRPAKQEELKKKFGAMINATPTEIALHANTSDGENIVVMGLELAKQKARIS